MDCTENDKRWMRAINNLVLSDPNDARSKIPGRNALPRLIARRLVRFDKVLRRYVLTDHGHGLLGHVIDFQI